MMADNIMFIPAVLVLLAGAGSLIFLIWAWIKAKRRGEDGL
jgi:hypothetical protein